MLEELTEQFGIHFTQDAPGFAAVPFIDLPMTLPKLEQQLNLPADPRQDHELAVLQRARDVRFLQWKEAEAATESLIRWQLTGELAADLKAFKSGARIGARRYSLLAIADLAVRDHAGHSDIPLVGHLHQLDTHEHQRGVAVDERTDIWSLGVVVYEMLAQRLPFTGATRMDTIVAILHRDPAPLSEVAGDQYNVSPLLEQTINRCLRKDMTGRLGSANELLGELKRLIESPELALLDS